MIDMTEPLLNKQDLDSPTWKKIEGYLKDTLDNLRHQNDVDMSDHLTSKTRGRIDMCKQILSLNPENTDI